MEDKITEQQRLETERRLNELRTRYPFIQCNANCEISNDSGLIVSEPKMVGEHTTLTPCELAMQTLGYIPEGTPETWEEVNIVQNGNI